MLDHYPHTCMRSQNEFRACSVTMNSMHIIMSCMHGCTCRDVQVLQAWVNETIDELTQLCVEVMGAASVMHLILHQKLRVGGRKNLT